MSQGVHQVLAGSASRDAITIHALAARDLIRDMGLRSEIFVQDGHIAGELSGELIPHHRWDAVAHASDAAILHYSIASPAFWHVADRTDRLAVHYHNITPAELLWEFAPGVAVACAAGRAQLGDLAGRVRWAAADSSYNAHELDDLGFPEADVVGVLPRLALPPPQPVDDEGRVRVLFVGRGVPNKGQHDLVLALAALREAGLDAQLRLVGSWVGLEEYRDHCMSLAETLCVRSSTLFLGSVTDQRLADEYGAADIFLCLSSHEGYCVPLVEAMAHDVPIVAYARGAVSETAGRAALLLDERDPSLVAESVIETLRNDALRARMARGREDRLEALSFERVAPRIVRFVEGMA